MLGRVFRTVTFEGKPRTRIGDDSSSFRSDESARSAARAFVIVKTEKSFVHTWYVAPPPLSRLVLTNESHDDLQRRGYAK